MSQHELLASVKQTIAKVCGIKLDLIADDASFDDLELDSLSRVEIVVEMERKFKLELPEGESDEDLVAQMTSIPDVVDLLIKHVGVANA